MSLLMSWLELSFKVVRVERGLRMWLVTTQGLREGCASTDPRAHTKEGAESSQRFRREPEISDT